MKIISFTAENVKKLRAIAIRPEDAPMVQITGRNGQGKSSVLDAVWWILTGQKNVQDEPIRKGALTAQSTLEIGGSAVEFIMTRSWRKNEKDETLSNILVETAQGSTVRTPQSFLDSLIGSLALDPLEFARADEKKQYEVLTKFVTGYDFEMEALKRQKFFDDRTLINRKVTEAKTLVDKIIIGPEYAIVKVDEDAILAKLRNIATENENIAKRTMNRKALADKNAVDRARAYAIGPEISALQERIDALQKEAIECLDRAAAGEKRIAEAPP